MRMIVDVNGLTARAIRL